MSGCVWRQGAVKLGWIQLRFLCHGGHAAIRLANWRKTLSNGQFSVSGVIDADRL